MSRDSGFGTRERRSGTRFKLKTGWRLGGLARHLGAALWSTRPPRMTWKWQSGRDAGLALGQGRRTSHD